MGGASERVEPEWILSSSSLLGGNPLLKNKGLK